MPTNKTVEDSVTPGHKYSNLNFCAFQCKSNWLTQKSLKKSKHSNFFVSSLFSNTELYFTSYYQHLQSTIGFLFYFTDEIIAATQNTNVIVKYVDMSSQQSVRKFAADILQTETKIDVLILNAGIALSLSRYQSNWFI
jgi:hypothetical protein